MQQSPSLAPCGRLVWVPETGGKGMVFIQGAGLTRAQIDRARPVGGRIGWWQHVLRTLILGGRSA